MAHDDLTALKAEQTARIVLRDTTLYVHIASIIAIYGAEGQAGTNIGLVYSIRAFASVLAAVICSIYASNDFYISRLAYFTLQNGSPLLRKWEAEHRNGGRYRAQKILRTVAILIVYPGWATWQTVPVMQRGFGVETGIAIGSWCVLMGATFVYLAADKGRG